MYCTRIQVKTAEYVLFHIILRLMLSVYVVLCLMGTINTHTLQVCPGSGLILGTLEIWEHVRHLNRKPISMGRWIAVSGFTKLYDYIADYILRPNWEELIKPNYSTLYVAWLHGDSHDQNVCLMTHLTNLVWNKFISWLMQWLTWNHWCKRTPWDSSAPRPYGNQTWQGSWEFCFISIPIREMVSSSQTYEPWKAKSFWKTTDMDINSSNIPKASSVLQFIFYYSVKKITKSSVWFNSSNFLLVLHKSTQKDLTFTEHSKYL